jgi:hypothetical protein
MKKPFFAVAALLLAPSLVLSDAGVLIPRDQQQPNPAVLSLEEMEITVRIDNGDARVFVRQVFANHTTNIEEGEYVFALPSRATVSDFAVWDGPTRIPAVILERKRAGELYEQVKQQSIDPGLLQMGERGAEEASRSAVFNAKIVPIPAYGTKRLEFEYHESIPVENLKSYFAVPLRPDAYQAQVARHLRINFELNSAHAIANFQSPAKIFPLQVEQNTAHEVRAHFEADNVNLARRLRCNLRARSRRRRHVASRHLSRSGAQAAFARRGSAGGSQRESIRLLFRRSPSCRESSGCARTGNHRAKCRPAENGDRPLRHFPFHAVGKAGAKLSGA